jgi:hypothetical protein
MVPHADILADDIIGDVIRVIDQVSGLRTHENPIAPSWTTSPHIGIAIGIGILLKYKKSRSTF